MSLLSTDKRCYAPIAIVWDWLSEQLPEDAKIIDIGPGHMKFPRAQTIVDCRKMNGIEPINVNLLKDRLPFEDKSFDFVYCRHVLEDMWNPFHLLQEMSRIGRSGYIETPSPIAEMCRGIDTKLGTDEPMEYRGYHHHHYLIWSHNGKLQFLAKYPLIEYFEVQDEKLRTLLTAGPWYWNTYFPWEDEIEYEHKQSPIDFHVLPDYPGLITEAINQSIGTIGKFGAQLENAT